MSLEGKVAIVTGASSGMGRETARRFVREGARVVGFARRAERLAELADELGEAFVAHPGDQMRNEDIAAVVAATLERFGRVDILVNAAGINDNMVSVGGLTQEWFDTVIRTDLAGPIMFMREVIGPMTEAGAGCIVNIASVGGLQGCRAGIAYTAAKHGVIGATKNVAYMYQPRGIRCNAICPGPYNTECVPEDPEEFGAERSMVAVESALGFGQPEKIAGLVTFLVSEDASDINGAVITSDFGWTAC